MSTIFIKLAKRALTQALEDATKESKEADEALTNKILVTFGRFFGMPAGRFGRHPEVAEAKRAYIAQLKEAISQCEPQKKMSDEELCQCFMNTLDQSRKDIKKINPESGQSIASNAESITSGKLIKARDFLSELIDHFKRLKYLDQYLFLDIDMALEDPLTKFRYAAAQYLSDKLQEKVLNAEDGHLDPITKIFKAISSSTEDLVEEKEALLISILQECISLIESLKGKTEEYKKHQVLRYINLVIEKNEKLCTLKKCQVGHLDACMKQVKLKIEENDSYNTSITNTPERITGDLGLLIRQTRAGSALSELKGEKRESRAISQMSKQDRSLDLAALEKEAQADAVALAPAPTPASAKETFGFLPSLFAEQGSAFSATALDEEAKGLSANVLRT